ncbi:uncharacterized protein LOC143064911 isoform X1 [Mytilus galloprovincialis]|uniref:uncharacterized protein LOC143064911 isoform X1 n=1 Tax=Mytilus galloprovincialis TaxID=29158 RepID=UPI003F7B934A
MNIVDEDDVEVERFKEYDSSLTDHHRGLFEEVNIPNRRRYLKWCIPIVVFLILGIAAVGIAADLGLFSSKTTPTTQEITGDKTDRGSCLLHDMSDKNVDPFIDTCKFGSRKVKKKCNESPQSCKDCCEDCEMLLPIVCFCDEILHCPVENSDRPAKMEYNKCVDDYCPCQNGGNCSKDPEVSLATAKDIKCSCPEGFSGHYCQHIPIRICEEQLSTSMLQTKICSRNYDAKCHISQNNSTFICKIPQHQSETHNIPNCTNG